MTAIQEHAARLAAEVRRDMPAESLDGAGDQRGERPPDPAMVAAVEAELGATGLGAVQLAEKLEFRYQQERVGQLARRLVRDEQAARDANLEAIDVVTAEQLITRPRPERRDVLGELVREGHNATITARYKTGKTTVVENAAAALVSGGTFLHRYPTPAPMRVAYLNYEMDPEDMSDRVEQLALTRDQRDRLLVVNLRGHRLPLMTDKGRDWLARTLADHQADVAIIDPFGAAFAAAGGQNENDNAEGRRFTTSLDEIKRLAGCRTLLMPHHTGRGEQNEGDEHGRGMTVLDDWADVRIILTRDKEGRRYLRSEGRAHELDESRLTFDPATRGLWLDTGDVGLGRRRARELEHTKLVVRVVTEQPGLTSSALEDALAELGVTNNDDKRGAIAKARSLRLVHHHPGKGNAKHHHPGPDHEPDDTCGAPT